ncbi:MAG: hypothetical protein IJG37_09060 [Synergistaceae bacterium]|nr:hypothetical protein [Synergistaceae bacterium]
MRQSRKSRKPPNPATNAQAVKASFREKLQDPSYFTQKILNKTLWPVQAEILRSVRDNMRTAVRSCHGIGKTFTAAMCILWFLYTRPKAIVLSTAPTWRQVEKLIWKEIRSAYRESAIPLGGNLLPKTPELHLIHDEWYAAGLSTNEPDRFQGFHEEHILVVVDEAAGVNLEIYEAIEGILTSSGARLLLIGNPTAIGTPFYDAFTKAVGYKTFHVSAYDTPNFTSAGITPEDIANDTWQEKAREIPYPRLITPQWVSDRYKAWGESSAPYQVRVMGNFPQQGEDTLIPLLWIELAMERWEDTPDGQPVQIGVDVAAFGSDKTVIAVRKGQKVTTLNVYSQKDTRETAGLVRLHAQENETQKIAVDEIGIGRGVVDSLEEEGFYDVGVNVAERATDPERYHNLRAELWYSFRELLDPDKEPIALPPDDELLSELASVKYKLDARGAIQIESKEDMKKRLGHSPDRADAVVLAFANTVHEGYVSGAGKLYVSEFF